MRTSVTTKSCAGVSELRNISMLATPTPSQTPIQWTPQGSFATKGTAFTNNLPGSSGPSKVFASTKTNATRAKPPPWEGL